jgi:hypothetical protein
MVITPTGGVEIFEGEVQLNASRYGGTAVPVYIGVSSDIDGGTIAVVTINEISLDVNASSTKWKHNTSFQLDAYTSCEKKVRFYVNDSDTEEMVGRSDFVDFTSDPDCGQLVKYKGIKEFAGIPYDLSSPYLWIRIPGVFFKDRHITEQKSIPISNGNIVSTASVLFKQKKFEIQDAPGYMHSKIILVFQHAVSGSLLIRDVEWLLEEGYEEDDSVPNNYPFYRATVHLTRKNYVKRNVI